MAGVLEILLYLVYLMFIVDPRHINVRLYETKSKVRTEYV